MNEKRVRFLDNNLNLHYRIRIIFIMILRDIDVEFKYKILSFVNKQIFKKLCPLHSTHDRLKMPQPHTYTVNVKSDQVAMYTYSLGKII
jgi:hypothetical protein